MKFLIAEDDPFTQKVLAAMLAPYGSVTCVESGKDAISAFTKALDAGEPFDVVCLDVLMPGIDGREALQEIRAAEERGGIALEDEVLAIMTTSVEDKTVIQETFVGLRAAAYMVKPVRRSDLLSILHDFGLINEA